ncbi:NADH-quinone oxidoreductase subunit NuoK [Trueperella bernardiae]|uniref:NADH-quinone oxidoreductase subunit NuoK n=1 Tax=Trueperella bernardiae TaxID=59561 RepID=UPI002553D26A|nr:NADH-quinone oxidoreductase subunit NuoK [Trueperella bernardiae]WIM07496.1 NADH-quinone oxidoreductase subunit NuoK [Trueperella bernardiae]
MDLMYYVVLAIILFVVGGATVLTRRNGVIALLGVEIMLNSCNLVLITFSRMWGNLEGQVFAFFVIVVAAAEVVVGLAIIVSIFRTRRTASLDGANLMKN